MLDYQSAIGITVGERAKLTKFLGEGAYGFSYEGELQSLGRGVGRCAVKFVEPRDPKEALELVATLQEHMQSHNDLLLVMTYGIATIEPFENWIYCVMELGSESLEPFFNKRRMAPSALVDEVSLNVGRALRELHEHQIAHRRVRPSNIVKVQGQWKLSGHEFSVVLNDLVPRETPLSDYIYRAPEMFEGSSGFIPEDIWAYGVLIYGLLTGKPVIEYEGLERQELIRNIIKEQPYVEGLHRPYQQLCSGCLIVDSSRRYTSKDVVDILTGAEVEDPGYRLTLSNKEDWEEYDQSTDLEEESLASESAVEERLFHPWHLLTFMIGLFVLGGLLGWIAAPVPPQMKGNTWPDSSVNRRVRAIKVDIKGRIAAQELYSVKMFQEQLEEHTLELAFIPEGEFLMGSPVDEPYREEPEGPAERVSLEPFLISRTEVTRELWGFVQKLPKVKQDLPDANLSTVYPGSGENIPVCDVSWLDCQEFCARISAYTGRYYRLPTEAEWEYAARAGSVSAFCFGPTMSSEIANYNASEVYASGGVGSYRLRPLGVTELGVMNAFGLFHTHGNVKEWCHDSFRSYGEKPAINPVGRESVGFRMVRGGGWNSVPWRCRSASRLKEQEHYRGNDLGFRVVVPAQIRVDR